MRWVDLTKESQSLPRERLHSRVLALVAHSEQYWHDTLRHRDRDGVRVDGEVSGQLLQSDLVTSDVAGGGKRPDQLPSARVDGGSRQTRSSGFGCLFWLAGLVAADGRVRRQCPDVILDLVARLRPISHLSCRARAE